MAYRYLSFSITIVFISFIIGMATNAILKKTGIFNGRLSNLNFIQSEKWNKYIGVDIVKWIIKNTPFQYFNQKLKLKNKIRKEELYKLRQEMTKAEIEHLIGFAFVTFFAFAKFYKNELLFGLTIMVVNTLMNLYPTLLQQQNKRRIDKLINKS